MIKTTDGLNNFLNTKGPTIIVGDFNCPDINWKSSSTPIRGASYQLYHFVTANCFSQSVDKPTRGNSLDDLVFINQPMLLSELNVDPPFSSSDHCVVSFTLAADDSEQDSLKPTSCRYLWKQGDYRAMSEYLNSYDWSNVLSVNFTPDDIWSVFCNVLYDAINLYVPKIVVRNSLCKRRVTKYPSRIRKLLVRKRCLWKQQRRAPENDGISARYKRIARECREAIRSYESSQEANIIDSQNIGAFYKFVNSRLRNAGAAPVLLSQNGSYISNDDEKADRFNCYFNSVNVDDNGALPDFPRRTKSETNLTTVTFTATKLYRVIRKLKPKLTCDIEGFSPYLIKQLASALVLPLELFFSSFFSVGQIPSSWRKSIITPIYKKDAAADPANYRPVSITSAFGKIMERMVAADISEYLISNGLLDVSQHGFLSAKSTVTNLLESVNDWSISIECKQQNRVAYIDFSRAFDSVCHSKLLHKLKSYGIDGELWQWIFNFLSERQHCTRVGSAYSSFKPTRSGVVQGSCLGPLLF